MEEKTTTNALKPIHMYVNGMPHFFFIHFNKLTKCNTNIIEEFVF